jgi:predicted RNA methylase
MIWPPDSPWAPWWRTSDETIRKAFKLARLTSKDTVYDLGSGDGRSLIIATKEFGARAVGIEIDPLRYYISVLMIHINKVQDKVRVHRKNFFDVDISKADVIFVYLVPKALERLRPKFEKELKKTARIVCINYEINLPKIKSVKTEDKKTTLYKIP